MTRLDSAIRRLTAQRGCLDWACSQIHHKEGLILELGLGNGRTYDHIRSRLPEHRIMVFDRVLACHPESRPPPENFVLGELRETLPKFAVQLSEKIILAHLDLGGGAVHETQLNLSGVEAQLASMVAPKGLVLSDQSLGFSLASQKFLSVAPPEGIEPERYFIYQKP
ncbi:MAG: hypothetical protein O2912_08830 [Proteobacteria bacterium]|nr:hypothetical protein [Pseudomonadota bacterium]